MHKWLIAKPEGKRPLGRRMRRWEDIRINLREVGRDVAVGWIYLAQDKGQWQAVVVTVMNIYVP